MNDKKHFLGKGKIGPGGIDCACCRKGSKKKARKLISKGNRRLGKSEIRMMDGA